jgi:hypothetical protein
MSDLTDPPDSQPRRPSGDDSHAWLGYWRELGQPWRTQPEITEQRQRELAKYQAKDPDPSRSEYPFKGVRLKRADVEWLLAADRDGLGHLYWDSDDRIEEDLERLLNSDQFEQLSDSEQLDLRGADLVGENLSGLPMARLLGGEELLRVGGWSFSDREPDPNSGIRLERAYMRDAHLDLAELGWAHLEEAWLNEARLRLACLGRVDDRGAGRQAPRVRVGQGVPESRFQGGHSQVFSFGTHPPLQPR